MIRPFTALALTALLTCFAFAEEKPTTPPASTVNKVQAEEFEKAAAKEGVVILDVRTPEEFKTRRLKGAVLIPIQSPKFDEQVKSLDKTKTYAVYCAIGVRSMRACTAMEKAGFTHLYNLEGGINAWEKAGKPVEKE